MLYLTCNIWVIFRYFSICCFRTLLNDVQTRVSGLSGAHSGSAGQAATDVSQSLQDVKGFVANLQGDIRTLLSRSQVS